MAVVLRAVRFPGPGPEVDLRLAGGIVEAVVPAGSADLRRRGDEEIGAPGARVLPGLVDSHVHWTQWAQARNRVDVGGARSPERAAALLAGAAAGRTGLVTGQGFRAGLWSRRPHKDVLERALPGVAVALVSDDLHAAWLSPAALAVLGRDHPTGLFVEEQARIVVAELTAAVGDDESDRAALDAASAAAASGLTGIGDFEFADALAAWSRRAAGGRLPLRVRAAVWEPWLDRTVAAGLRTGDVVEGTAGLLEVGPFKVLADGSLNTRTAACHHPYPDAADGHGVVTMSTEELVALLVRVRGHGLEPAVHAIGDRANAMVLDAFDRSPGPGRIEHAQLVRVQDVARFVRPGLVASVQPQHATADRDVAERHWPTVTARAFPFADLAAAGARLEFGSDAPVSPPDPWAALADAITRTDDDRPPWHPEQALDRRTALRAASAGRAAVRAGDPADLTVVGTDPLAVDPSELRETPVLLTLCGGEPTHRTL
ncbi:amidohydrolase family protein [Pseudonocardia tropica]|uniref:Amidohydrolase family protein n=1 Tax=Pseudonocardia tropica TaxID=681289 RepID=A0ABV1JVH3_9PSEU